ncbi:hypothetical protein CF319_g8371 [Tilletia indica]|nr:hypothetical protein CF319_g8371 [Tilletia indica]
MIPDTPSNRRASFSNLPTEIRIQIFRYCQYETLKALLATCKATKVLLETPAFDWELFRPSARPISTTELERLWDSCGAGMIDWNPLFHTHRWRLDWSWQQTWLGRFLDKFHCHLRICGLGNHELSKSLESATNPPVFGLSMGGMTRIIDKSGSGGTITVRDVLEEHFELSVDFLNSTNSDHEAWRSSWFKVLAHTVFKEDDHFTVQIDRVLAPGWC